jgi:hypothetical protein
VTLLPQRKYLTGTMVTPETVEAFARLLPRRLENISCSETPRARKLREQREASGRLKQGAIIAPLTHTSTSGVTLLLPKFFLAGAHLLAQRLGIDVRVFHLRKYVPLFLSRMSSDFITQLTQLFIIPSVARF